MTIRDDNLRRAFRHRSVGKARIGFLGGVLVFLATLSLTIVLLFPLLVRYGLPLWLERQGVTFSMDGVEGGPLAGELVLQGVRIGPDGHDFTARRVVLEPDLGAWLTGNPALFRLGIAKARMGMARTDAGQWRLGGYAPKAWFSGLGRFPVDHLALEDLELVQMPGAAVEIKVPRMTLSHLGSGTVEIQGEIHRDELRVALRGRLWPSLEEPEYRGNLAFSGLSPEVFLAPDAGGRLDGHVSGNLDLAVDYRVAGKQLNVDLDGRLEGSGLTGRLAQLDIDHGRGQWRGEARFKGPWPEGVEGTLRGNLVVDTLEFNGAIGNHPVAGRLAGASGQGRTSWSGPGWGDLSLDLDGDVETLDLHRDGEIHLERVALWGVSKAPGETLTIGGLRVAHLAGEPTTGDDLSFLGPWRAERLEVTDLIFPLSGAPEAGELRVTGIRVPPVDGSVETRLSRLEAHDIVWARGVIHAKGALAEGLRISDTKRPDASLKGQRIALVGINLGAGLVAERARLEGLDLSVLRDPAGAWHLPWPGLAESAAVGAWHLELEGDNRLTLIDYAVSPRLKLTTMPVTGRGTAWGVENAPPGHLEISGPMPDGGQFSLAGSRDEGPEGPGIKLETRLSGLPAAAFAGYSATALGLIPTDGRITLEDRMRWTAREGTTGRMVAYVTGLTTRPSDRGDPARARVSERLGKLLANGRGAFRLEVPWPVTAGHRAQWLSLALRREAARIWGPAGARDLFTLLNKGRTAIETSPDRLPALAEALADHPGVSLETSGPDRKTVEQLRERLLEAGVRGGQVIIREGALPPDQQTPLQLTLTIQ